MTCDLSFSLSSNYHPCNTNIWFAITCKRLAFSFTNFRISNKTYEVGIWQCLNSHSSAHLLVALAIIITLCWVASQVNKAIQSGLKANVCLLLVLPVWSKKLCSLYTALQSIETVLLLCNKIGEYNKLKKFIGSFKWLLESLSITAISWRGNHG